MKKRLIIIIILASLLGVSGGLNYLFVDRIGSLERVVSIQEQQMEAQEKEIELREMDISMLQSNNRQLQSDILDLEIIVNYYVSEVSRLEADVEFWKEDASFWEDSADFWENHSNTLETALEMATFTLGEDMLVMPSKSPEFDCDDSALYMYLYFRGMGYDVRIIKGNLSLVDESLFECNHVWVWVRSGGFDYSYDWGRYYSDNQHRYGYSISYFELLSAAKIG